MYTARFMDSVRSQIGDVEPVRLRLPVVKWWADLAFSSEPKRATRAARRAAVAALR